MAVSAIIGATAVSAVGSIQQGKAAKKAANFQASADLERDRLQAQFIEQESAAQAELIAREGEERAAFTEDTTAAQALVAEQRATREREIAKIEEEDYRRAQDRTLATKRAALGGSGIRLDTGTFVLAEGDFVSEAELQALRIRSTGELNAVRLAQEARAVRGTGRKQAELFRSSSQRQAETIFRSGLTEAQLLRSTGATNAALLRMKGRAAQTAGFFRAGSSLLSGGAAILELQDKRAAASSGTPIK